jgi:multidrug efflux pump subunit AcrA (membrane-fusion protein)
MKSAFFIGWLAGTLALTVNAAPTAIIGITEPLEEVTLSAPVSGIITVQALKEGDFVKAGGTILELDKKMEELELERRKLIVEVKSNDLQSTKILEKKESEHKLAMVERDMAAEQLKRRVVTAPLSGTITEIFVDVGEGCQPLTPLVKVVDARQCIFVADVEPALGAKIKVDQMVPLEIQTGTGALRLSGKIIYLAPVVDAASGLLKLKAVFENPEGKIRPGVAGKMSLE